MPASSEITPRVDTDCGLRRNDEVMQVVYGREQCAGVVDYLRR